MEINQLQQKARWVRAQVVKMAYEIGGCHLAGPLSVTDLLIGLYFGDVFRYRAKESDWSERDRLILSCGHYAPAWYATLAQAGYFAPRKLKTLRQFGSILQGHPSRKHASFVEASSGLLGQGLSVGVGMGLGLRLAGSASQVWVICSDAEPQEGQFWEAVQSAAKFGLGNLKLVVDHNGIQIDGYTNEVMPQKDLVEKMKVFGWTVIETNGHQFGSLLEAYKTALVVHHKPVAIIAQTIGGQGVSFMEDDWRWHDGKLTKSELERALKELRG